MIDQRPDAPETVIRMSYPRLYASADRETHFQDVPVSMTPVVYVPDLPDHPLVWSSRWTYAMRSNVTNCESTISQSSRSPTVERKRWRLSFGGSTRTVGL